MFEFLTRFWALLKGFFSIIRHLRTAQSGQIELALLKAKLDLIGSLMPILTTTTNVDVELKGLHVQKVGDRVSIREGDRVVQLRLGSVKEAEPP